MGKREEEGERQAAGAQKGENGISGSKRKQDDEACIAAQRKEAGKRHCHCITVSLVAGSACEEETVSRTLKSCGFDISRAAQSSNRIKTSGSRMVNLANDDC
jgi:hypothetical protein